MSRKLTKEEFINREPDLLSGEYEFVGEYINKRTKTLFKHIPCGYEWMVAPGNFYQGSRCPRCAVLNMSRERKFTKDEFNAREKDIQSGEYEMLGEYINSQTKTTFRHNICGYQWEALPNSFHQGSRCLKCARVKSARDQTLTKEDFIEREKDIQSGEYKMLGRYANARTKTLFKHAICGYEWEIEPYGFHRGTRCPRCKKVERFSKKTFCKRENVIQSKEYSMLGEYINARTKTLFKHNICGYEWEIEPRAFHDGERCPRCKQSAGESCISDLLSNLNIPFEAQKRFNTCKYNRPLPFDFYINDSFLVEFDGEQHFKPADFGGRGAEWAIKNYELGKLRDNIKTKWAKDNGIPLVRIPYTEFDNIEQIIKDSIEKYSIQKVG
ncbi:hypothetical protein PGA94_09315 [Pediococcus pentosaceus]|uniref:hypothetical protein n=1 Tax=Pediococcus pentosaceus TaxID=1255 RepID=UPI00232F5148|nr:hypothetical protein [Pediococcus pentosaceus]MDB1562972.1 hypothetical protein [Pediococcus pentosaceus]